MLNPGCWERSFTGDSQSTPLALPVLCSVLCTARVLGEVGVSLWAAPAAAVTLLSISPRCRGNRTDLRTEHLAHEWLPVVWFKSLSSTHPQISILPTESTDNRWDIFISLFINIYWYELNRFWRYKLMCLCKIWLVNIALLSTGRQVFTLQLELYKRGL